MPKCFTCKNKIVAEVRKEERRKWGKIRNELFMPELVFICAKTNIRIEQTLPYCHEFEPDEVMTEMAQDLKNWARKQRENL